MSVVTQPTGTITLAIDGSSTTIGWAVFEGNTPFAAGTFELPSGEIASRCAAAQEAMGFLVRTHSPDRIAVESPVGRFAKAVIPQSRVSGALLAEAYREKLPIREVTPTEGKKALTGKGVATKEQMIAAAARLLGFEADEHASDAVGVGVASLQEQQPRKKKTRKKAAAK